MYIYDPDSKAFVGNGRLDDALFRFALPVLHEL